MRDKIGWASTSPRIASAQAKLAGDEELLSMMELLQKAHANGIEGLSAAGLGIDHGPLTGPANYGTENVFEKSFTPLHEEPLREEQTESPQSLGSPDTIKAERSMSDLTLSPTSLEFPGKDDEEPKLARTTSNDFDTRLQPPPARASLKRTYTDISGLSLQYKLTEAMAQPFHSSKPPGAFTQSHGPAFHRRDQPQRSDSLANERTPHGHRSPAQAIFTTDMKAPWTITSANDMACLVFGVTRAEVRRLGIMEVISEERRKWLEEKLRNPETGTAARTLKIPESQTRKAGSSNSLPGMGNGVTAKLLSKPPARTSYSSRKSKTAESTDLPPKGGSNHTSHKSRGVLLCGDVVPIRKMNGATGSASFWVKEKGGGLIWVLEEIAEDIALLTVDEIGSIVRGTGDIDAIWGLERVRRGMDVQKLIPQFPKMEGTHTGALDYDAVARLRRFTVRTSNSISIPVTVDQVEGESTFRVSSFPHIAGIMVVHPKTMCISSSNSVFSAALFGHASPDGMAITQLIPSFDKVLHLMTDEDKIRLVDGIVIPEHSFRRARALLALREGAADAAAILMRPSGLPAKHRDGSEIMVDVSMRVVKSDRDPIYSEAVIEEETAANAAADILGSEVVYALWITYSRQLHAVNNGIGPVAPLTSRPGTPPHQPGPGNIISNPVATEDSSSEKQEPSLATLTQKLHATKVTQEASPAAPPSPAMSDSTVSAEPYEHPSPLMVQQGAQTVSKKRIDDFAILEEMGAGAYGQVKLARYKKAPARKMVIKYVTKRRILVDTWHRDRRLGTVPLEIHVLDFLRKEGLQHPNIVEMADFFEDDVNYYIEMVPHGLPGMDLFDYIELRVTMDEAECRMIFRQVAAALQHLHCVAKVVHRDIKDENVILDGVGNVKIVDFGSAAYIKSGPFDVFVGTIDYAAPEVLRGSPYRGKEQDVWALGILLYTIVYKENPFYSIDEIMDHDLRVPFVQSESCLDLIRKMLDRDVEARIGINAVCEHEWTKTIDSEPQTPEQRSRVIGGEA
ncbi:hypothetical protein MBLNU230_g0199t2 [Neophaeotheca triangularis]